MANVTPIIPAGRQVVESYGGGGFRISGERYEHSVLVLPEVTLAWEADAKPVNDWAAVNLDSLAAVCGDPAKARILLIGTGAKQQFPTRAFRQELRAVGFVVETMDTGAACRTYNVLMAEGRDVAAALIAVE